MEREILITSFNCKSSSRKRMYYQYKSDAVSMTISKNMSEPFSKELSEKLSNLSQALECESSTEEKSDDVWTSTTVHGPLLIELRNKLVNKSSALNFKSPAEEEFDVTEIKDMTLTPIAEVCGEKSKNEEAPILNKQHAHMQQSESEW
jgi:hypothetical protein